MSLIDVIKNHWKKFFPSEQARIFAKWKRSGSEEKRYMYNIPEHGYVMDVGGYKGDWAAEIWKRYRPTIHIFEPVPEFYQQIKERFSNTKKIVPYNFGLSGKNEDIDIFMDNNRSSRYVKNQDSIKGRARKTSDFLKENNIKNVDLIKINIEGGEYDLLEDLIISGRIKDIKNIQVQFHNFVPNAEKRMEKIQTQLSKTHRITYQYRFVWENWERNKLL